MTAASRDPAEPDGTSLSESLGFPETVLEVGPMHPGLRRAMAAAGGSASFVVRLDDDRIRALEVEIGWSHRGVERQLESVAWDAARPFVSRLGYASGVLPEIAWCLAVESLAGLALPDRAIWLRMFVGELARAVDHLGRLAAVLGATGLREGEARAARLEWAAAGLLARATGRGPIEGFCRFGGVEQALPEDFGEDWAVGREALRAGLDRLDRIALASPALRDRLTGVARLDAATARAWGVTGPLLRASGVAEDVRRDRPYLGYAAVDFDVPVGETGDALDGVAVVAAELRQALAIAEHAHGVLVSLGPGPIAIAESEAEIVARGIPAGEAVATVEAATGELALLVVSDGGPRPLRVRVRAPSFFHAQVLPRRMLGERLDELLPVVALSHLVGPECDR